MKDVKEWMDEEGEFSGEGMDEEKIRKRSVSVGVVIRV